METWESPLFAVKPFHYYRACCTSRAQSSGYWAGVFCDAAGQVLEADSYDTLFAGPDWNDQETVFRACAEAAHMKLRFQPAKEPFEIAGVSLQEITSSAAAQWVSACIAQLPVNHYAAPPGRGEWLPATRQRLRDGGTLRIVMLGDSITNDTSNSLFETTLHERYAHTRFEVVNSVRGATGTWWYAEEERVKEFVLRYEPDLLIIAGASQRYYVETIRSVVRQVRAKSSADILLVGDAVAPAEHLQKTYLQQSGLPEATAWEDIHQFPHRVKAMVEQEKIGFLDMRAAWDEYLRTSPQPLAWYLRDAIHANWRGKQVVGEILSRYLAA